MCIVIVVNAVKLPWCGREVVAAQVRACTKTRSWGKTASPPPPDDLSWAHGDDMESYYTILYALWRLNLIIIII